jgi:preprotein translocase subunit SecB
MTMTAAARRVNDSALTIRWHDDGTGRPLCSLPGAAKRRGNRPPRSDTVCGCGYCFHLSSESFFDMADETSADLNNPALQPNGEDTSPAIGLISQYVKDLSFENPNAPAVYQWQEAPQVDVQFNIAADSVGENLYEVTLKIDVTSKTDAGTSFVIDLKYAGLFGVRNVPDDQLQPFFLAEAPRILFPFARRVVADAVRDGGFAPLLLEPIDFHGLFAQQVQAAQAEAAGEVAVGQA